MLFHLTKSRQSLSDSTIRLESFEVQGKTNLLDATRVSEQKENIFSTFIKYGEKKANINCNTLDQRVDPV